MQIDLEAIALEPATLKDRQGTIWSVDPEMTAGEALLFMNPERMKDYSGGDVLEKIAAIVSRGLVRKHPAMTTEAVLDKFTPMELGFVVARFLSLTGLAAALLKPAVQNSAKPTRTKSKPR